MPNIRVPTLFMFALDDPIIGDKAIDYETCFKNPNVMIATTKRGGHTGYFESVMKPDHWFPKPMLQFLNSFRDDLTLNE